MTSPPRKTLEQHVADYDTANKVDVNPTMDFRFEFNQKLPQRWWWLGLGGPRDHLIHLPIH